MNFKNGDKVVCIEDGGKWYNASPLELGKSYTVRDSISGVPETILIEEDDYEYRSDRFVLLEEYRSMKINKIKNKINEFQKG